MTVVKRLTSWMGRFEIPQLSAVLFLNTNHRVNLLPLLSVSLRIFTKSLRDHYLERDYLERDEETRDSYRKKKKKKKKCAAHSRLSPDRLVRNGDSGCIVKLRRKIRLKGSHVLTAVETAAETIPPNRVNDRVASKETRVCLLGWHRGRSSTTVERIRPIKVQEPREVINSKGWLNVHGAGNRVAQCVIIPVLLIILALLAETSDRRKGRIIKRKKYRGI